MRPFGHGAGDEVCRAHELGRPARRRCLVQLLRRPLLHDLSVAHQRDPVCQRERLLAIVGHEDDGDAERSQDRSDLVPQLAPQVRIDIRPGLVEQDRLRSGRERPGERDTLLLTTGELMGVAVAEPTEVDEREQHRDPRRTILAGEPEGDVLGHGEVGEERVVLEHHPDSPSLGGDPAALSRDRLAGDRDPPRIGCLEPGDQAEQGRLAAAGRAEERDDLAAIDAERRRRDSLHVPEASAHALECDHRAIHVRRTLQAVRLVDHRNRRSRAARGRAPIRSRSTLDRCASHPSTHSFRRARSRARSPTRFRTTSARARSCRCGWGAARRAASSSRSTSRRLPGSSSRPSARYWTRSLPSSSTSRSGSPTTTARHRPVRSSSSHRSGARREGSGRHRRSGSRFRVSRARLR